MRVNFIACLLMAMLWMSCTQTDTSAPQNPLSLSKSSLIISSVANEVDSFLNSNLTKSAILAYTNAPLQIADSLEASYLTYKINKAVFYNNYFYPCDTLPFQSFNSSIILFQELNQYYVNNKLHDENMFREKIFNILYTYPDDTALKSEMLSELGRFYFHEGNQADSAAYYYELSLETSHVANISSFNNIISSRNLVYLQYPLRQTSKAVALADNLGKNLPVEIEYDEEQKYIDLIFRAYSLYRSGNIDAGEAAFQSAFSLSGNFPCTFYQQELYKLYCAAHLYVAKDRSFDEDWFFRELESLVTTFGDFCNYGKVKGEYLVIKKKQFANAEALLERAFQFTLDNRPYNSLQVYTVTYNLYQCYFNNKKFDKALDIIYSEEVGKIPDKIYIFNKDSVLQEKHLLKRYQYIWFESFARVLKEKYKFDDDLSSLELGLKYIKTADSLVNKEVKTFDEQVIISIYKTSKDVYTSGSEISLLLYEVSQNETYLFDYIYYVEKNRSRILYRDLALSRKDNPYRNEYIAKEKAIRQKLELFSHKEASDSLLHYINKMEELYTDFYQTHGTLSLLADKSRSDIKSMSETKLNANEIFLDFNVLNNEVCLFFADRDNAGIKRIPLDIKLKGHLNKINSIESNTELLAGDYSESAYYLYQNLLSEIIPPSAKILYSVSGDFATINPEIWVRSHSEKQTEYSDLEYLIHDFHFERIESIYLYERPKAQSYVKVTAFLHSDISTLRRSNHLLKEQAGNLIEQKAIAELFPKPVIYQGRNCNKEKFLKQSDQKSDILHISVHGHGSAAERQNLYLLFRAHEKPDTLFAYELLHKTNGPPLVVLAACESGKGKHEEGEGDYTLARYFLQSGTQKVIRSLWNLDDTAGSLMMRSFYQNLSSSHNPAESLQKAKVELLHKYPNFAHPYFWGGLI